jgi:hypothetical protein
MVRGRLLLDQVTVLETGDEGHDLPREEVGAEDENGRHRHQQ